MKKIIVLAFLIFCPLSRAQNPAYQTVEIHINELIDGTLLLPDGIQNPPDIPRPACVFVSVIIDRPHAQLFSATGSWIRIV